MSKFFKIQKYEKPSQYSHNYQNTHLKPNIENIENEIAECENAKKDFCPLNFLLERDVGIADICPTNGVTLATGYSCTQDLRHRIEFWTLGYFDRLLIALGETRPITRKVQCISLNRYRLPRA